MALFFTFWQKTLVSFAYLFWLRHTALLSQSELRIVSFSVSPSSVLEPFQGNSEAMQVMLSPCWRQPYFLFWFVWSVMQYPAVSRAWMQIRWPQDVSNEVRLGIWRKRWSSSPCLCHLKDVTWTVCSSYGCALGLAMKFNWYDCPLTAECFPQETTICAVQSLLASGLSDGMWCMMS